METVQGIPSVSGKVKQTGTFQVGALDMSLKTLKAKDAAPNAPTVARVPSEGGTAGEQAGGPPNTHPNGHMDPKQSVLSDNSRDVEPQASAPDGNLGPRSADASSGDRDGRPRRPTNYDEPLEQWERDEFEALLEGVNGHLGKVFETLSSYL